MYNRRGHRQTQQPKAFLASVLLVLFFATSAAAQPQGAVPVVATWTISPTIGDREEAASLSGLACARRDGTTQDCLLVNDEKRYARLVTLKERTIALGAKLPLLPAAEEDGTKNNEADAEAADFDGGFYYVIGSHARTRKAGQVQPSRSFVYRVPVDPATGRPSFKQEGDKPAKEIERSDRLRALIADTDPFNEYLLRSFDAHDPNIEGLAVRGGRLYAGFRAPSLHGEALILSVPVNALFEEKEKEDKGKIQDKDKEQDKVKDRPKDASKGKDSGKEKRKVAVAVTRIKVGQGQGIRDLAKVKDGFLVLTGPEAKTNGKAEVFFWDGRSAEPALLGQLAGPAIDAKPEALLVLEEEADRFRVLVISDDVKGGAPAEYRLPRPRR